MATSVPYGKLTFVETVCGYVRVVYLLQADETCAACFAGANLDGTCESSTATDCRGAVDYYCCVAGDACSDNPVLLNWLSESRASERASERARPGLLFFLRYSGC